MERTKTEKKQRKYKKGQGAQYFSPFDTFCHASRNDQNNICSQTNADV